MITDRRLRALVGKHVRVVTAQREVGGVLTAWNFDEIQIHCQYGYGMSDSLDTVAVPRSRIELLIHAGGGGTMTDA